METEIARGVFRMVDLEPVLQLLDMELARRVALRLAELAEEVRAVAEGGSRAAGVADRHSDIDLYVYAVAEVPLEARAKLARQFAGRGRAELDNRFWEPGDEWVDGSSGVTVDIMYRSPAWIEDQLDRVLVRHQASLGYSTCFWWNVRASRPLVDRDGWFARLQERAAQAYPEPLRRAIIARNRPVLDRKLASYRDQIAAALERADAVSVNHRLAAYLASYFDILFALNRVPHPGEKRLMENARRLCPVLPRGFDEIPRLFDGPPEQLPARLDALAAGLDEALPTLETWTPGRVV